MNFVFKSETHLGDCLLHAHFMRKVIQQNSKITFDFYLIEKHWDQTYEYVKDIPQIKCLKYENCPAKYLIGWVGQFGIPPLPCPLDGLRLFSYKNLCKQMGITCPFNTEYDLLYDNDLILNLSYKLPKYDVLLINSTPLSNQTSYLEKDYKSLIEALFKKNKTVITTKKIEGVDSTLDLNLSVVGIGALSINCKIIAGIGTGSMQCCLNKWNVNKKIFYIDQNHTFNMQHINMISSINKLVP